MSSNRTPITISERWDEIIAKEQALEELVRINQELGLYEDYNKITRNNQETQALYNAELDTGTHYN